MIRTVYLAQDGAQAYWAPRPASRGPTHTLPSEATDAALAYAIRNEDSHEAATEFRRRYPLPMGKRPGPQDPARPRTAACLHADRVLFPGGPSAYWGALQGPRRRTGAFEG